MSSLPNEMPAWNAWRKPRAMVASEQHRVLLAGGAIDLIDDVADFLLGQKAVDDVEGHLVALGQAFSQQHAARRGFKPLHILIAGFVGLRHPADDLRVQGNGLGLERLLDLQDRKSTRLNSSP